MDEVSYRESRLCRLLGNPVVYQIVVLLAKNGPLTPGRLGALSERSVQTISGHLARLRTADVVRYETRGRRTRYWLKHPKSIERLLRALEGVVRTSTGTGLNSFRRFGNSRKLEGSLKRVGVKPLPATDSGLF